MNVGPVIEAQFPGRCAICQEEIAAGDSVRMVDDEWCHASCAEDEMQAHADFNDVPL